MSLADYIPAVAVCAWAAVAALFSIGSAVGAWRLWRRVQRRAMPAVWPRIVVMRPCEGDEPGLEENLLSSATARYDGARAVLLLVPSRDNGAYPAAERARARAGEIAPGVNVDIVVTAISPEAANRKAAQLAVGAARMGEVDVVVQADSDVRFDDRALPAVVAAVMEDERVGAASAPPVEVPAAGAAGFPDRLSATVLSSSQQSFLALSGLAALGGTVPQVGGALLALRRPVVDAIDGFRALEPFLGEDHELTQRLYAGGWRVATAGVAARCFEGGRSLGQVLGRFARWALVVRRQRPALFGTYFLLLACTPLVLLTAITLVMTNIAGAWAAVGAALALVGARTGLALVLRRCLGLGPRGVLAPFAALGGFFAGELLLLGAASLALVSDRIVWRGRAYRVRKQGRLVPADA